MPVYRQRTVRFLRILCAMNPTGKLKRENPRNLKCLYIIPQLVEKGKAFLPHIGKIFCQKLYSGDFDMGLQTFIPFYSFQK